MLNRPIQHLDALFWDPGWRTSRPPAEWRTLLETLVREPRWIMDGTYESTLHLRLPAADSVVIVERSRVLCLWRAFVRAVLLRRRPRPDAPPGERFTVAFVRYIWRYARNTRPVMADVLARQGAGKTVIVLRGSADEQRLLRDLSRALEPS